MLSLNQYKKVFCNCNIIIYNIMYIQLISTNTRDKISFIEVIYTSAQFDFLGTKDKTFHQVY